MRVRKSPYLYVEREEDGVAYVRERAAGNRAALNRKAIELLTLLEEPRDVPEHPQVRRLLELGFLVEEGEGEAKLARAREAKLLSRVAPLMFGCPGWRESEAWDFAFVGVPSDAGNLTAPGARSGPDAIRQASALYAAEASDQEPGKARGWIDHDTGDELLKGARLGDAGEVYLPSGLGAEESGQRISSAVRRIAGSSTCPVVLGGDHSITFGAARGALRGPAGLLHLDAHSDASRYSPGMPHHYGNVVSRVLAELDVRSVLHVGVRGLGRAAIAQPPTRLALSSGWVRSHSAGELLELMNPELEWYVSIDIDVVDPAFAPGTATPVPAGLSVPETKAILRSAGRARRVVGCDLVELNPSFDHNRVTALLGCELLLTLLGAIWGGSR
jgi:arginase family enzyme